MPSKGTPTIRYPSGCLPLIGIALISITTLAVMLAFGGATVTF